MAFDHVDQRLVSTPEDTEVSQRMARLRALGIGMQPDPEFDEFASALARAAGTPYAMVNFITDSRQYFAGLHTPSGQQSGAVLEAQAAASVEQGRTMPRDHGFCPHVVSRRLPLVLDDVCEYPRFAGNPVVDDIGIRSYMGAPLIDRTGTSLGTICAIATEARPWGRPGLDTIKTMAAELMKLIQRRETRTP